MSIETLTLILTALTIGVMHTALGPDHYVPLVALAKVAWAITRGMRALKRSVMRAASIRRVR